MKTIRIAAAVAALALSGCQQPDDAAAPASAAPSGAETAVPADQLETLRTQVVTLVKADADCVLPEGMQEERAAETIDLGGGDAGVLVVCSTGTADQWSRIYVSQDGAAPVMAALPLYKYQGADDWMT